MELPPKAGLYYPNKFGLIIIKSLEEVMGRNGLNAILRLAGVPQYVDHYPADNLEKGFDFAELSSIGLALEELYGPRGGRGLALRAGRATFTDALKNFGALAGVADLAKSDLSIGAKLGTGLRASAKMFAELTDQITAVEEQESAFIWKVSRCPCCWGRHGEQNPACHISLGLLMESLSWVSGGREFRVDETKCIAMGDEVCQFTIPEEPIP